MSRSYRVDIDVGGINSDSVKDIASAEAVLREHCFRLEGRVDLGPTTMGFYGELSLAGGQSPEEKHEELVAALAPRTVASRWLDLDAHLWDYEFGGESDTSRARCQDCGWEGEQADCDPVTNLSQRVDPGEPMPAGECPECGALCQLVED